MYVYIYWEVGNMSNSLGGALFRQKTRLRNSKILAGHSDTVLTVAMKGNIVAWPTSTADLRKKWWLGPMATSWGSRFIIHRTCSLWNLCFLIMIMYYVLFFYWWYDLVSKYTINYKFVYKPHEYYSISTRNNGEIGFLFTNLAICRSFSFGNAGVSPSNC